MMKTRAKNEDLWLDESYVSTPAIIELTRAATLLLCHEIAGNAEHAVRLATEILREAKRVVLEPEE